MRTSP